MGMFWNPITDVINSRLKSLKDEGLVQLNDKLPSEVEEFLITDKGTNILFEMIMVPIEEPPYYNTRIILPMNLLFLHWLDQTMQKKVLFFNMD